MENTTKVWVVSRRHSGFGIGLSSIESVFLSKQEAEYYVWQQDKANRATLYSSFSYRVSYLSAPAEVDLKSVVCSGKDWDKFKKEQIERIDKEIEENSRHSEEDLQKVDALKKEREKLV